MEVNQYINDKKYSAAGCSIVGQVRKANEDSCGYSEVPNGQLFVVCDGMGGHVGGAVASKIAVESIINFMKKEKFDDVPRALDDALKFANIQIIGKSIEDPFLKGMGTTACIVLLVGSQAWIAHVGDSRIYLFTGHDKILYRVTKDHSYVQMLVDKGELDDRQAEHHPRKNVILKALGIDSDLQPEVVATPLKLSADDCFLICSDGLSGMIEDDAIEEIMRKQTTVDKLVEILVDEANAPEKGKDNITAQVIKINESENKASIFTEYNPKWRKTDSVSDTKRSPMNSKVLAAIITTVLIAIIALFFIFSQSGNKLEQLQSEIKAKKEKLGEVNNNLENYKYLFDLYQKEEEKTKMDSLSKQKMALESEIEQLQHSIDSITNKSKK